MANPSDARMMISTGTFNGSAIDLIRLVNGQNVVDWIDRPPERFRGARRTRNRRSRCPGW